MNWKLILLIGLFGFGAYQHFANQAVTYGNGAIAKQPPIQQSTNESNLYVNVYQIKPLQSFEISARVLSSEHYSLGREADLSPVDLAFGWGPMSDEAVLKDITITQSGRFYYWQTNRFSIPREQIEQNSANMHMIPADKTIANTLNNIKNGQVVTIKGFLVEATASDGWHWKSSLSRIDTGAGACEIVYVKSISIT